MATAHRPRRIVDLDLESAASNDPQALIRALRMAEHVRPAPARPPLPHPTPPLGHSEEPFFLTEPDS